MKEAQQRARFHRFGDLVAFHFDDTPTLYVSEAMARKIAEQFTTYADDIAAGDFSRSPLGSKAIEDEPTPTQPIDGPATPSASTRGD